MAPILKGSLDSVVPVLEILTPVLEELWKIITLFGTFISCRMCGLRDMLITAKEDDLRAIIMFILLIECLYIWMEKFDATRPIKHFDFLANFKAAVCGAM